MERVLRAVAAKTTLGIKDVGQRRDQLAHSLRGKLLSLYLEDDVEHAGRRPHPLEIDSVPFFVLKKFLRDQKLPLSPRIRSFCVRLHLVSSSLDLLTELFHGVSTMSWLLRHALHLVNLADSRCSHLPAMFFFRNPFCLPSETRELSECPSDLLL